MINTLCCYGLYWWSLLNFSSYSLYLVVDLELMMYSKLLQFNLEERTFCNSNTHNTGKEYVLDGDAMMDQRKVGLTEKA